GGRFHSGRFLLQPPKVGGHPLKRNWLLVGLADDYNRNSRKAQRIVFDGGVLKPLVEASRQKMFRGGPASKKGETDALAVLVRLEADVKATNTSALDLDSAKTFLTPLLTYVTGHENPVPPATFSTIVSAMVWRYPANGQPGSAWPAAWLSESSGGATNLALMAGLAHAAATATNSIQEQ